MGFFVFVGQIGALTSHWLIKEKKIKEAHNPMGGYLFFVIFFSVNDIIGLGKIYLILEMFYFLTFIANFCHRFYPHINM